MSTAQDLAALTLKDLRQLAGEHQIKNRSRLSKTDLVAALQDALSGDESGDRKPAATTKDQPKAKAKADEQKKRPAAAEPEVLDPAAVAALTGDPAPARSGDDATERSDDGEGDGEGGGRKRRRRRRRGRGRGKKRDGDGDNGDNGDHGDSKDRDQRSDRDDDRPAARTEAKPEAKPEQPTKDRKPAEAPAQAAAKADAPAAEEAPAPQLAGKQRKLPPVLDRLQTFTAGVLELCDPDTPAWAQARLSELLADAGVAPIPCHGQPHAAYHEVVGEAPSSDVPAGHIAVIEAPGFALRGDRGDLFPLRKARVKVAGNGKGGKPRSDDEDRPAVAKSDERRRDERPRGTAAPADSEPAAEPEAPEAASSTSASAEAPRRERSERPRREAAPAVDEHAASSDAAVDPSAHASGPVLDEPEPRAPARATKVTRADEAPQLPLQPQEAEELAARPKAEGWRALGLHEQILADLADVGFEQPTDIQAQAIGIAMSGRDLIGQSQTGSGKTAAFLLPTMHRLYQLEGQCPAALVLCPTRELARQVHAAFVSFAGKSGARAALIYGGVGMNEQFQALARHPHVVIGTPGRIIDHARRKTLDLSNLAVCILDEADQMLDIGFLPDIEWILKHTPPKRQMLLFSATMPDEIRKLAAKHMHDPDTIHIAPKQVTVDQVDQKFIAVDPDKKTALLAHFIETYQPEQMVVFCNTKHQTDRVANVLKRKKLSAQAIHGDLPQAKREKTLNAFRDGSLNCLIATNVAARGLDIPSVSHVVNYDIPSNPEEYVHRVGRTARMGRTGVARTFVTPEDGQFVVEIEKHIGLLLEEEVVEGMQASTAEKPQRSTVTASSGPRLLKPLVGGIRLGRGRRR